MADKWNRKICVEHITELKSPFQNKNNISQMGQKVKAEADRLRIPKQGI